MDDSEQTVTIGRITDNSPPATPAGLSSLWADHRLTETDAETGPSGDAPSELASLSFIMSAIRRRARFWCLAAVAGVLLGSGVYLLHPPAYKATTEILLTMGPNEDLQSGVTTDATLAQSRPVAGIALKELGSRESVSSLLDSYTALPVTNRVLDITAGASNGSQAVRQANAVAQAFLQYRASQLRLYEKLVGVSLTEQLGQAKAQVTIIENRVKAESATALQTGTTTPPTGGTTKLASLQAQLTRARDTLSSLQQSARDSQQTTQVSTDTAIKASQIVNTATVVVHSRLKIRLVYGLIGLIVGLFLGLGFVIIEALVSDRLRRRSDIAYALGAPVRTSTGRVRIRRLLPGRYRLKDTGNPDVQRIARHLRDGLPHGPAAAPALALIPADEPGLAALTLVAVALSCGGQGKKVALADLCAGSPAARLLGVAKPGVHQVEVQGTTLVVTVPERGDLVPTGPLRPASSPVEFPVVDAELAAAYSAVDVQLTLAALDPMLGAEHLVTWASDAVVMVTAGGSSWTRLQAVGEMIRLAGPRLVSGVLVGADRSDESLGTTHLLNTNGDLRRPVATALVAVNGAPVSVPKAGADKTAPR